MVEPLRSVTASVIFLSRMRSIICASEVSRPETCWDGVLTYVEVQIWGPPRCLPEGLLIGRRGAAALSRDSTSLFEQSPFGLVEAHQLAGMAAEFGRELAIHVSQHLLPAPAAPAIALATSPPAR